MKLIAITWLMLLELLIPIPIIMTTINPPLCQSPTISTTTMMWYQPTKYKVNFCKPILETIGAERNNTHVDVYYRLGACSMHTPTCMCKEKRTSITYTSSEP